MSGKTAKEQRARDEVARVRALNDELVAERDAILHEVNILALDIVRVNAQVVEGKIAAGRWQQLVRFAEQMLDRDVTDCQHSLAYLAELSEQRKLAEAGKEPALPCGCDPGQKAQP